MSKGLYIAIALLITVAATLVLVQGKDSKRSSIHLQGPPAQSQAKHEKLRNFDAQIVAAARFLGCSKLYTEDLNAGQSYDGVTVINPLASLAP